MQTDFLIIGGGIAGASIGYHLAQDSQSHVMIAEMEDQPGYHTTGRSAAFYAESYGGPAIRPLTSASKGFLNAPPADFSATPFLTPRGALHIFMDEQRQQAEAEQSSAAAAGIPVTILSRAEAIGLHPLLAESNFVGAILDKDCGDLDVAGLHQAYLRGYKRRGGQIATRTDLQSARYEGDCWQVQTQSGVIEAKIIINAAGAWADTVAQRCGVPARGLQPFRRTVITADVDDVDDVDDVTVEPDLPLTLVFGETLYFKPESGRFLLSPEDSTPSPACDCQPEIEDIALAVERFEQLTGKSLGRPKSAWAGLRTFAPDGAPVIGFDPQQPAFFWNAGQGGYGIQTCPAWAEVAAKLAQGQPVPEAIKAFGASAEDYNPARLPPKG